MKNIPYPSRKSEAEIQSLSWMLLRSYGIDARMEVPTERGIRARLDIVLFDTDKQAVCIIECKSWSRNYTVTVPYRGNNTKQIKKYRDTYELPVLICARMNVITSTIKEIEKILNKP